MPIAHLYGDSYLSLLDFLELFIYINVLYIIYAYYISPVCHLPFNFHLWYLSDPVKILSNQIHQSFPLLPLLQNTQMLNNV